jgi:hypothetical protein
MTVSIPNALRAGAVALPVQFSGGVERLDQRPYNCRLYDAEQRKCAFGSSEARTVDRLLNECLRDGGRP